MTLEEEDEQEERARFAPRKASELIRIYGWSAPEAGQHQFTRNADNTLRQRIGWILDGPDEAYRYCINAAVARAYYGTAEQWGNASEIDSVHLAQVRLAQHIVHGPVGTPHDAKPSDLWVNAIGLLARWQDADGRTAGEVIELLEREGL